MNTTISSLISVMDLLPGAWCLVDANSKYLHYNLAYLQMIGAENLPRYELIGKTVADMPCKAAQCAELFWKADEEVRRTKKCVTVVNTIKMENDQWWVLQINKSPIFNDTNEVEAILFNCIDHSNSHYLDLTLQVSKDIKQKQVDTSNTVINIKRNNLKVSLGAKESGVLFFMIKGMSYKQIASLQNIAYSTVVDHVDRLKNKFNASTVDELIKTALLSGYPQDMPECVFEKQFSIMFTQ